MTPFVPKGDAAEWRAIYGYLVTLAPDTVVTIKKIEELLGRDLGQNRSPVYRAIKELERNHSRTLATVRGTGYRVAQPQEHLGLSLSHSSRARRNLKRGYERSTSADRAMLEPVMAARLEAYEATTSRLIQFLGHMARTIDQQAHRIGEVEQASAQTNERVDAVERALKRHGLMDS
jgi:biotin operon repressor